MRITKKLAILGFNLSSSIFVGLCVYGILIYFEGEARGPQSLGASLVFAAATFACISGICYFGRLWDRRNAEDARNKAEPAAGSEKSDGR